MIAGAFVPFLNDGCHIEYDVFRNNASGICFRSQGQNHEDVMFSAFFLQKHYNRNMLELASI